MRRVAKLLLVLAACLSGCGEDAPDSTPQRTVRDFVDATNERDAQRFCDELVTQEYLERSTGVKGEAAPKACKKDFKALRGLTLKLIKIRKTQVKGERAAVRVELDANGRRQVQLLRLQEVEGRWKLSGGSGS